jgi:UV excision repair protein RAD23
MKLTFRTITGKTFNVDAEPTTLVADLKASVEESQGSAFPKTDLKLVYKGKILEDGAKPISDYGVDESGFLVVFVAKPKPESKQAEAKPAGEPSSAPVATVSTYFHVSAAPALPCMTTVASIL